MFFVFQFLFCFVFLCLFFPFYLEGMGGSGNREVGGGADEEYTAQRQVTRIICPPMSFSSRAVKKLMIELKYATGFAKCE